MGRSLLDYCVPVWVFYKKGDIEVLEKVLKLRKASKIIPKTFAIGIVTIGPTLQTSQRRYDRNVEDFHWYINMTLT